MQKEIAILGGDHFTHSYMAGGGVQSLADFETLKNFKMVVLKLGQCRCSD
jgi:hypothetical protein